MKNSISRTILTSVRNLPNKVMLRLSDVLGLTTGIGVIVWGAWSLILTVGVSIYERTGIEIEVDQVAVEDAFNQGVLQSAMLIALGAVILELRRIGEILEDKRQDP